jgi:divalent metal cation (Fe/Co/Zn/Cd) transporter
MFVLGGGISVSKGILDTIDPRRLESRTWSYAVLLVAAVFEGTSWWVSRKELFKRRRAGETSWDRVQASKVPAIFVVFVEDTAALVGIGIALVGVLVGHLLDNPLIDPVASIGVGVVMIFAAIALARETGALLVGEGMDHRHVMQVRRILHRDACVRWVGNILTMQLGPSEVLLTAEVGFEPDITAATLVAAATRLEGQIRTTYPTYPTITRIFLRPGISQPPERTSMANVAA